MCSPPPPKGPPLLRGPGGPLDPPAEGRPGFPGLLEAPAGHKQRAQLGQGGGPVSYTHLTLPTILLV
eukprot:7332521-Pyramimonas_sp.AAC.1